MDQLWDGGDQSVRQVHAALAARRELAYTTVMTVLDRLAKKGLVHRERDGRAWTYRPATSREALAAELADQALGQSEADRSAALVAFVDRVSPDEAELLRSALDRLERSAAQE